LGATGSIGRQTLEVARRLNDAGHDIRVVALSGHANTALLAEQAATWQPAVVAVTGKADLPNDIAPTVLEGERALVELVTRDDVDTVMHAVIGAAGLAASFAAASAGKRLCLANKESLVCGGRLLLDAAKAGGCEILPVDSEHSAIFQACACGRRDEIARVILTASGGPFRDATVWPSDRLHDATVDQAMNHPTWSMGGKITIDSATLFNKALELIEAVQLFGLPHDRVEVVVHPQSVVHSMVEFADGATIAHLSPPDMKLPIGYAITHPHRLDGGARRMDWSRATSLEFEPPDDERFPALRLARRSIEAGPTGPLVLNAANEVARNAFMEGRLRFGAIAEVVAATLDQADASAAGGLEDLLEADRAAREIARRRVSRPR
jgi:1-deoxy-D-xylulose-5-phosphate reductoisomerase